MPFVAALALYLLFNAQIPVTDPVESNYALTAKEMLLSGDWLSPRIYGQYWFDKPAMTYWLIILSYKIFGINEFAARLPSAVFSALSIQLIYWFTGKIAGSRRVGWYSALVLATSVQFWLLAKMIITDSVLFFFNSLALAAMYLGLYGYGRKWIPAAYAAAGLAVLTKGPVGIVLPALIIFSAIFWTRRWEWFGELRLIAGTGVFMAVVAPWYAYMYIVHGSDFVATFLGLHNYLRATVSEHPEENVFYYYLIVFPVSLLPWSGIFCRGLLHRYKGIHADYLLLWFMVTIVFYTLMATKYLTYVFPALFPAAVLAGCYLYSPAAGSGASRSFWLMLPAVGLLAAAGAGARLLPAVDWCWIGGAVTPLAGALIYCYLRREKWLTEATVLSMTVLIVLLSKMAYVPYAVSRSAHEIVRHIPSQGAIVASLGEYSTSAVFYSGYTITRLVRDEQELAGRGVWAGKYTMPAETISAFDARTRNHAQTYVLVGDDENKRYASILPEGFVPVAQIADKTLYKRR